MKSSTKILHGHAKSGLSPLVRAVIGSGGIKILYTLLGFALVVFLARILGPEQYGIYAFAQSLIILLAFPAQMGLPILLVRQVARYDLEKNWRLLRGLMRRSNQAVALISIFIGIAALGFFVLKTDDSVLTSQEQTFVLGIFLIPFMALGNLRGAALRGMGHVVQGQIPELLLRPAIFILLLAAGMLVGSLTPQMAMLLQIIASVAVFLIGAALLARVMPADVRMAKPQYDDKGWIRSVFPLSLLGGMQVIHHEADLLILGLYASKEDVGIFQVAVQGAYLVVFSLSVVNMVLAPTISRLYVSGNRAELQKVITWGARIILAASLPICCVLIIFGESILTLVFGREYAAGHGALAVLSIGQLINAMFGSVLLVLNMSGHERDTALGTFIGAMFNIILGFLLIPRFGIMGAAYTMMLTMIFWNGLLSYIVYRRLGIQCTAMRFSLRKEWS